MGLAGKAFLALWNDVDEALESEYQQWHSVEHVPERVSVQGFVGARRYVNRRRTEHRYFTLYEVRSIQVFDGPEYVDLIEHPTRWSSSMRPHLRNMLRATCAVLQSAGVGVGGAIACFCVPDATGPAAVNQAMDAVLGLPQVNACHVGVASDQDRRAAFASAAVPAATRDFDRIILVEALDHAGAGAALAALRAQLGMQHLREDFGNAVYDLAFVFPGCDPAARLAHRRAYWAAS